MLIGYLPLRPDADGAEQRLALVEAGCEQVVEEQLRAGGSFGQPKLHTLLTRLRSGDVVVVPQLDRLGPSLADVVRHVQRIAAAGAGLRSLADAPDAAGPLPAAQDGVEDGAASDLPGLAVEPGGDGGPERTGVGRPAAALTRRRRGGRPPKLSAQRQGAVLDEVLSGRRTAADMARRYKVSEATISRLLAAHRAQGTGAGGGGRRRGGPDRGRAARLGAE